VDTIHGFGPKALDLQLFASIAMRPSTNRISRSTSGKIALISLRMQAPSRGKKRLRVSGKPQLQIRTSVRGLYSSPGKRLAVGRNASRVPKLGMLRNQPNLLICCGIASRKRVL
jgi:hypothetical protein